MTDVIRRAALTLTGVLLFVAGCSVLAPQRDASRFFTLSPLPDAQSRPSRDRSATSYGLGPVKLPVYLDRHEVATRVSPTEVTYSPTDRWAEPLEGDVTRVLLRNFSALLETDNILVYPWPGGITVDYEIEIDVLHFEHTSAGDNQLDARWRIKDGRKGAYVVVRDSVFRRADTASTTAAAVAALSATLGDLSQEITSALQQLPKPQETPPPRRKKS